MEHLLFVPQGVPSFISISTSQSISFCLRFHRPHRPVIFPFPEQNEKLGRLAWWTNFIWNLLVQQLKTFFEVHDDIMKSGQPRKRVNTLGDYNCDKYSYNTGSGAYNPQVIKSKLWLEYVVSDS